MSGSEQLRHPSDQLLMVAKQRISCSHIRIGVFIGLGIRMLVSNGMEHQDAVCLFQQLQFASQTFISFVYGTNVLIIPEKIPYLAHPFAFCRRIAYLYVALLLGLSRNKGMF